MLLKTEHERLEAIERELTATNDAGEVDITKNRRKYKVLREAFHLYEDVVRRCHRQGLALEGIDYDRLRELAGRAIDTPGGQPEPCAVSLKQYDHRRYGPYLGVSDDGKAVAAIRDAMLCSPKMRVLGPSEPIVVGGAHDAERLGAVGEVAIGPVGYRDIRLGCVGRILTSTDVGTRLNLRDYDDAPLVEIDGHPPATAIKTAISAAERLLSPFFHTPDGDPRPVTLYACFSPRLPAEEQQPVLEALTQGMQSGRFCDPKRHRLGLLVRVSRGPEGAAAVVRAIDLAVRTRLADVAIEGEMRPAAAERISLPGLLNYFDAALTNDILAASATKGMAVRPWKQVDTDTVARNVWDSLAMARHMGLELGKYGLLPLTVEQADAVIGQLQQWFADWSAAPAIYVDCPVVTATRVYEEDEAMSGVKVWLDVISSHGVGLVLIDTADKSKGRCVLKTGPDDPVGILSLEQVEALNDYAAERGIKVLWAGGLSAAQAYDLGRLGVFGIYTTTSTAVRIATFGEYKHDPALASVKQPSFRGVYRVKLLLEAGFLVGQLGAKESRPGLEALQQAAAALIEALKSKADEATIGRLVEVLEPHVEAGWQKVLGRHDAG